MTQEALKLALDALEDFSHKECCDNGEGEIGSRVCCEVLSYKAHDENCKVIKAITAIKEALAQEQEQEAVGYWKEHAQGMQRDYDLLLADYEKLAQPEQEPVAWQWLDTAHFRKKLPKDAGDGVWNPLYAAPQRTWVGLTDEEIEQAIELISMLHGDYATEVAYAIEAKLKEKNT